MTTMRWILTLVMTARCRRCAARAGRARAQDREGEAELRDGDGPRRPAQGPVGGDRPDALRARAQGRAGRRQDTPDRRRSEGGHLRAADGDGGQETAACRPSGEKNKTEGDAFLAANKAKEGVVTLPSGLQYKIITAGTGPKPTLEQTVVCHYRGTLIDGKEFDSSYKRGQPATFPVKGVIKGWTEVLQLMPVGSKWQVFIPSDLAYGERGAGADIGPNATLVFEIELVAIK